MNSFALIFVLVNGILLLSLPRRYAPLPLLVGACYMTIAQGINLGPFSFTVIRMLVVVGVIRVWIRGERVAGGMNSLDWLMVAFAMWALATSFFRPEPTGALVFRLGLVFNTCGIYFLLRSFCQSMEDLWALIRYIAILLIPIAIEMVYEQTRVHNLFSFLGGVPSTPTIREGNIRAQGPFRHAILAGTVGAVCFPLMVSFWDRNKKVAAMGMLACTTIVFTSRSSGPLVSLMFGVGGLLMWNYRKHMNRVRWIAVIVYIALNLVMKAPAYYLMARIPLVPGSTGWHRAELINSAIRHLNEWWLWGTDYTRHWMPTGVSWSAENADITNHYIKMGVIGGLPLMFLLILKLAKGFTYVGLCLKSDHNFSSDTKFMVWSIGASLFSNATTMISVSYFDQSFVFLYLTLAAIGSVWAIVVNDMKIPQKSQ